VTAGLAVLALLGWVIGSALGGLPGQDGNTPPAAAAEPSTSGPTTAAALQAVVPQAATLYDPRGDKTEGQDIGLTYDGKPTTSWLTDRYRRNSAFGGLKDGMGIAYDFGSPTRLREITVATSQPGTSLQILAGDSPDDGDTSSYKVVGSKAETDGDNTIAVEPGTNARYYIVYLTRLAPDNEGRYVGSLSEVSFKR
jgi:hypothetical protein